MAVTDPYPGQPTDGQSLDAVPILAKFNALFQGIQSFDGSQIQAGTVAGSAMQTSVNPNTLLKETESPFVATGLIWSSVSGLQGTMSSGIAYIANASATFRVSVTGVGSYTFTASKDTYIDIDYNGNVYYSAVANNATAPALTANSVRIAKIITNASAITTVTQSGFDSLGNLIYPTGAVGGLNLQSVRTQRDNNGAFVTENSALIQTGWVGYTFTSSSSQATVGVTFPIPYTHTLPIVLAVSGGDQFSGAIAYGNGQNSVQGNIVCKASEIIATGFDVHLYGTTASWTSGQSVYAQWIAIGA